jgi:hypothetical protein
VFGKSAVHFSDLRPLFLTEAFRIFAHTLKASCGKVPEAGDNHFLPQSFQCRTIYTEQ